jgi:penicillin amidase
MKRIALFGFLASAVLLPLACSSTPAPTTPTRPLGDDSVPITDNVQLTGLSGPVDAVRDEYGMIHIYATSIPDAMRVMGYQMGRDRHVQLELDRRTAEGRMAEAFGDLSPSLIDDDINARAIGLYRVAQQMCDALDPNGLERQTLDAFADGVSQYYARLNSGDESLPKAVVGFPAALMTPWTCADSLAIARLQSEALSFDADSDIGRQEFLDAAQSTFVASSNDPEIVKRVGLERDMLRFAPLDPTLVLPGGFPNDTSHTESYSPQQTQKTKTIPQRVVLSKSAQTMLQGWRNAQKSINGIFGDLVTRGSNNWVIGPGMSADGHPIVSSDPHLSLSAPSVFWMVHLSVHAPQGQDATNDLEAAGLAFPGIPVVILGENEHVAWGATTAGFDVTDVYQEKLSQDGTSVTFNGQQVAIQTITETINVAHGNPITYNVQIVPQHGPIIPTIINHAVVPPDPSGTVLSYRWTGLDPSKEVTAIDNLQRATSVEDVRTAMRDFGVGAQNWVSADDQGNIFYTSQSRIPQRMPGALAWDASKYQGTLPMFVLPGDGTAEWTNDLDEAYVPHVKNPSQGFVATANADQVGVTLDNDPSNDKLPDGTTPVYIGGDFDLGFRVGRITKRLQTLGHPATPDDMAAIQADVHSPFGALLAPKLIAAITAAEAERTAPGTHADLTAIVADSRYSAANVTEVSQWMNAWAQDDYASESGVSADDDSLLTDATMTPSQATLLFETWLVRMGMLTFTDEIAKLGGDIPEVPRMLAYIWTAPDPTKLATYDATTGESALFDDMTTTSVTETSESLAISALLDAIDYLNGKYGSDRSQWRWGVPHTLTFDALVPLWGTLSIPQSGNAAFPTGFPRHGDLHTIDVANFGTFPGALASLDFTYGSGPTQRFVADVQTPAPVSKNALPGGEVWDNTSPHFADEAERWRRNQNRPVWIQRADVIADAKERIAYDP